MLRPIIRPWVAKAFSSLSPTSRMRTVLGSSPAAAKIGSASRCRISSISVSRISDGPSCAWAGATGARTAVSRASADSADPALLDTLSEAALIREVIRNSPDRAPRSSRQSNAVLDDLGTSVERAFSGYGRPGRWNQGSTGRHQGI